MLCGFSGPAAGVRWGRAGTRTLEPLKLPWLGLGRPRTALLAMNEQASTVTRADWWKSRRDLRSPLRRCFKPRPLRRAECAGFASSCRSDVLESSHSPGGWPASCPATYRSTHGHRHVRNWARIEIIYLSRESTLLRARTPRGHKIIPASLKKVFAKGKSADAGTLGAAAQTPSAFDEGLDALCVQDETHHDQDTEQEEHALQDVHGVAVEVKQIGEGPAGGEGAAEHLGADQDGGAEDRQHVQPVDAAALWCCCGVHWRSLRRFFGRV